MEEVLDQGIQPTENKNPFLYIRGRHLMGYIVLSLVMLLAGFVFLSEEEDIAVAVEQLLYISWYFLLILLLGRAARKHKLKWRFLFGKSIGRKQIFHLGLLLIPLFIFSIGIIICVFSLLAMAFPEWVYEALFKNSGDISIQESGILSKFLAIIVSVVAAPIVEEILFRGFLLSRWTTKWNSTRAVLLSSLIFGIFHTDILGSFIFGCVMCILYFNTRSLFVPIFVHMGNNAFAELLSAGASSNNSEQQMAIESLQSSFGIGLIFLAIGICWFHRFLKKNWKRSWVIPYIANEQIEELNQQMSA